MVKAMGRQRRGSKTGGVEPATISLAVLAAIAGVAGYGSTRGELSVSDQLKVEAAVRARLEIERRKNPRSVPCPDFKPEREKLLAKLAEYESSEVRFRLATPDQIVKVVETVKEKLGVKMSGGEPEGQKEAVKEIEEIQNLPERTSVVPPVTETVVNNQTTDQTVLNNQTPATVEPLPTEKTDGETPATVEPVPTEKTDGETPGEPVPTEKTDGETPATVEPIPNKPTADIPMTAEILPKPDLVKAGVILDSIPKALLRPRLITVLIKLESATREPLDTLRKYFDEAFAKLEPGSKTPLKDALKKMRERGVNRFFPKKDTAVQPIATDTTVNTETTAVQPIATDTTVNTETTAVEPAVNETDFTDRAVRVEKMKQGTLRAGTRKKKLRTRRRDKQNVRRSSGGKNRSNRTDTYSSRRTEVDARGDELGL
jgi:hypothetical protein